MPGCGGAGPPSSPPSRRPGGEPSELVRSGLRALWAEPVVDGHVGPDPADSRGETFIVGPRHDGGALVLAVPIGVGTAAFLSELAPLAGHAAVGS